MNSKFKKLAFTGVIVLSLAWLPFLLLSFYNVPIGMHEWEWMTDYAGRFEGTWWGLQQHLYQNVMGRYTSNALLSLTSYWCTLTNFPFFFFLWQLIWFASILMLVKKGFNISWWPAILLASTIQIAYLAQLEDVYDSLFRYTALWTYQSGFLLSALGSILLLSKQRIALIAGYTVLFLVAGTNEISMIFVLTVSAVLLVYQWFLKKNSAPGYLIAFVVVILGTLIVVLAPGNELRMDSEAAGLEIPQLLVMTLATTAFIWIDWIGSMHLVMILLMAGIIFSYLAGNWKIPVIFNDPRPWLAIVILFVPVCMGALLYSTGGNAFPERVIDHMFTHVIFLALGLVISVVVRYDLYHNITLSLGNSFLRRTLVLIIGVMFFYAFTRGLNVDRDNKAHQGDYLSLIRSESNILNAWLVLIKGEAAKYHKESVSGLQTLYSCYTATCYMRKPSVLPRQLYDPLSDRRNRKGDSYMGYYFHPAIKEVKYIQIE